MLGQPKNKFELYFPNGGHPFNHRYRMTRDGEGYRSYTTSLGMGTWHMVLVSKRPGFLPCVSEEAIWQAISASAYYSTPLLRAWAGWLHQRMADNWTLLKDADCLGCKCGIMKLDSGRLDSLVVEGVKSQALTFV